LSRVGDALAQQHPVARRDAKQFGDAPDRILLELVDGAVGIGDVPHHFDDLEPSVLVEGALEDARELVKIDGVAVALLGLFDEALGRGVVEPEALLDQVLEATPSASSVSPSEAATWMRSAVAARR
jgi:hypothetical protein